MHELVRSILDRDVHIDGERYVVRSPTVREALILLASAKGTLDGEEAQRTVFFDTLASWLPADVLAKLTNARDYSERRVVAFVFQMINEGVPAFAQAKSSTSDQEETTDDPSELQWENVLAEYMSAYKMTLTEALSEPWNGFLLMSQKADMIHARDMLRLMTVRSVPYIRSDREREAVIEDLVGRAGGQVLTPEEKRQQALERQQEQLDKLAAQFASVGAFSTGGPKPKA